MDKRLSDGPFLDIEEFSAGIELVSCTDRQQATEVAAAHRFARSAQPFARYHAIEVRPGL